MNRLALAEMHNGARYALRCQYARQPARAAAWSFAQVACEAAREHWRQFEVEFTALEILQAAGELLEYTQQHNAESDALARDLQIADDKAAAQ